MNTSTLLKRANRLLIKKANELLKPYGIAHAYTYFLMELYQKEGMTQSEMHKIIGIEQPTAVRTLDRMERDGFIIREQSPTDRRAVLIKLTPKGKQFEGVIAACTQELNKVALNGLTDKEQRVLNQLLTHLNTNLDTWEDNYEL